MGLLVDQQSLEMLDLMLVAVLVDHFLQSLSHLVELLPVKVFMVPLQELLFWVGIGL